MHRNHPLHARACCVARCFGVVLRGQLARLFSALLRYCPVAAVSPRMLHLDACPVESEGGLGEKEALVLCVHRPCRLLRVDDLTGIRRESD